MPSTYTSNLGIELPADGELDGVWGDVVNDNMSIIDRATNGSVTLTLSGTSSTLTTSDGTLSDGQYKLLVLGGSPSGTHTITIAPSDAQKIYFVRNTTAQSVVFTQGSGGNVTVATGDSAIIYSDGAGAGAAVVNITNDFAMSSVKITGGTIDGTTIGGTTPAAGTFTTANATTVDTTNLEVTTLKAKDGTAAGSIADATGVVTLASSVLTTTDINGGTIDGAVIGGSSAAAGTFTTVTGTSFVSSGDMTFGDNDKAIFGAGSDLQIYHTGSNSVITDAGTGSLYVGGDNNVIITSSDLGTTKARFTTTDVELYYAGAEKLATTSTGVDVTGTVTADGLTVSGSADADITRNAAAATDNVELLSLNADYSAATTNGSFGGYLAFKHRTGGNVLVEGAQIGVIGEAANTSDLYIRTSAAPLSETPKNRIKVDNTGDISFYEDTGTTPKFFWDASAEALGIGTTSPATTLDVNGDVTITDKIIHSGDTNTAIRFPAADTVTVETAGTERMRITSAGNVGIGTSSPSRTLSVNGTAGFGNGTIETIISYSDRGIIGTQSNHALELRTNGTERMRIDASGNVGIGETAPDYKLDVNGAIGFTPGSSVTPVDNGDVVFELTNNTTLTIKAKGSDGVVRSATITLA